MSINHIKTICKLLRNQPNSGDLVKYISEFSEQDREMFFELSHQHGVIPLIYEKINVSGGDLMLPESVLSKIRQEYLINTARNIIFLHEASIILKAFKNDKIEVIGLKGLYLLDNVYSNIAIRRMSDLDIMVQKGDISKAITVLEELGYRLTTYFDIDDKNIDIKHVPPFYKEDGPYVEIHWTLLEENEPFSIDPAGLWARAVPAKISGVDALALSLEDLILHLSLHLTYQHNLQLGLRGLYDIALVIAQNQSRLDWAALVARAKEWGAERVLSITLTLLEEILDVSIPKEVFSGLMEDPIPPEILARAKRQLLYKEGDTFGVTPDLAKLSERSGLGRKLKLIASRIFLPKTTMARIFNVHPHSLKIYFYYPVRFYQLMRGYAKSAWQIAFKDQERVSAAENTQAVVALKHWFGHQE